MAPRSLSQFDPLDSHRLTDIPDSEPTLDGNPADSVHDSGVPSEDPALKEMIEEARRVTGASAAALALRQKDEILCRATSGASAPALDSRLSSDSGLSGACVKSRTFQRCDDSEIDTRVDAALCRHMGIRSILVFPILLQDELLGVVEVFSPKPNAFADIRALQSLSRLIANNLVYLTQVAIRSDTVSSPASEVAPVEEPDPAVLPPSESLEPPAREPAVLQEDYWTTVLTFVVIVSALALGWLLGLGVQRASMSAARKANRSVTPTAATRAVPTPSAPSSVVAASVPASTPAQTPFIAKSTPEPKTVNPEELSRSNLVVSQNGKVIYRQSAPPEAVSAQNSSGLASSATAQGGGEPAMLTSPDTANQYVTYRVEPEYPEQARQRHVQGPVTLKVTVDKNGSVKTVRTLQGDSQLAAAASTAVQQWRFKPLLRSGVPQEFQTEVTVIFRLP